MAVAGIHIEAMRDAGREPIRLLTISREYGAGGSELGVLLGEKLGWLVIDHELVRRLAARLSCEEGEVMAMDEHVPSFLERLASVATVTAPESRVHSRPWSTDPDCVAAAAREVLLEPAQNPPLIVVGHGGNCLFRSRPDVLRVRVTAPQDVRIRRGGPRCGRSARPARGAGWRGRAAPRRKPRPWFGGATPTGSNISSATIRPISTMPTVTTCRSTPAPSL